MPADVNPFSNIQISIVGPVVTVQYKVNPLFEGKAPYKFELIACEDETLTEVLYTIPSDTFFVVDDTRTRQNTDHAFAYQLKLIDSRGLEYYSTFFGWRPDDSVTNHHYLLAAEISRRERLRCNYTGIFAYVMKRKGYTAAQTSGVDEVTGEAVVDNTQTYGVAEGGYYAPILTKLSIEGRDTKEEYDPAGRGTQYTEMLKVRCAGFPSVDQHDVIITPDGKRFTVVDPVSKYFPGTTLVLVQTPTLRLVPITDTIYSIEVPAFPHNES